MVRPVTLEARPSLILTVLGGTAATLLLSALLYLAPLLGFPFIDVPRLVGGVFTAAPEAAFWLGYWIFFLVGVLLFAPLLTLFWTALPGPDVGFPGAVLKGTLWGILLWIAGGLILPAFGALNRLTNQGLENPGFFAYEVGILGTVGFLLGHLAYGIAVALVAAMGQGINPLHVLGWEGYRKGDIQVSALEKAGSGAGRTN